MEKTILVNATSLSNGGGLTILNQFMADLTENPMGNNSMVYVFVPDSFNSSQLPAYIQCLKNSDNPFYKNRNYWNYKGFKKWRKHNGITADELFSLQNYFPFGFSKIDAFKRLYLHQPIPFFEYQWSIFKKNERKLWFYRNVYYQLIKKSAKEADQIIVQTEWFKNQLIKKTGIDNKKILVDRPVLTDIDPYMFESMSGLQGKMKLFYPAADYIYKNHELLFKAVNLLVNGSMQKKDLVLYVTLEQNNELAQRYIEKFNLEDHIILTGKLRYEEVMRFYKSVDALVFPSKIETFGMPLVESKAFNLPIIAADLPLYREVIGDYEKPFVLCDYCDETVWASAIAQLMDQVVEK